MLHSRRQFLKLSAAALSAPAVARSAFAQTVWPAAKPIRAIVPFSAGSTIDILGRIVLDPVSRQLGQTIVVENRGGAGGSLGSAAVAKAEPDGYTLLINAAAHSGAPAAYPNLPYDAANDFAAVACFGSVPNVLLVAPSKGITTVQDLVAKAKSGGMSFASAGVGSATHWAAERFIVSAGLQVTHVPFRGGPEALTEVMTGRVDFIFIGISSGLPFIQNKQLVPLANARLLCRTFQQHWRLATGIRTSTTGTACWCRQRPRSRSSSASTWRRPGRWRCPRCSRN
jgi:tripartite-type tricarboxylate transporter receptor subunit TctC